MANKKQQLTVILKAVDKTKKAFASIQKGLKKIKSLASKLAAPFKKLNGLFVGLATGALALLIDKTTQAGQQILNVSNTIGVTTDRFQELYSVIKTQNPAADVKEVGDALKDVAERIAEARAGEGEVFEAAQALNLNLALTDTNAILDDLFTKLGNVENAGERIFRGRQIVSDSGFDVLAPLIGKTTEELNLLINRSKQLGLIVSPESLANLAKAQKAISTLKQTFTAFALEAVADLAPHIEEMSLKFQAFVISQGGAGELIEKVFRKVAEKMRQLGNGLEKIADFLGVDFDFSIDFNATLLDDYNKQWDKSATLIRSAKEEIESLQAVQGPRAQSNLQQIAALQKTITEETVKNVEVAKLWAVENKRIAEGGTRDFETYHEALTRLRKEQEAINAAASSGSTGGTGTSTPVDNSALEEAEDKRLEAIEKLKEDAKKVEEIYARATQVNTLIDASEFKVDTAALRALVATRNEALEAAIAEKNPELAQKAGEALNEAFSNIDQFVNSQDISRGLAQVLEMDQSVISQSALTTIQNYVGELNAALASGSFELAGVITEKIQSEQDKAFEAVCPSLEDFAQKVQNKRDEAAKTAADAAAERVSEIQGALGSIGEAANAYANLMNVMNQADQERYAQQLTRLTAEQDMVQTRLANGQMLTDGERQQLNRRSAALKQQHALIDSEAAKAERKQKKRAAAAAKIAAITAFVATYAGAAKELGKGGLLGLAAAAKVIAAGLGMVAAIKQASAGLGGGAGGGGTGGGGGVNTGANGGFDNRLPQQIPRSEQGRKIINLTIQGSKVDADDVEEIIRLVNDGDGTQINADRVATY